jgi:hypothetical protein
LVQAGVGLYTVQKLRRWKSISLVTGYAHHHPENLRAGVEVLDRVDRKISRNLAQRSKSEVAASLELFDFIGAPGPARTGGLRIGKPIQALVKL